ncbi:MAG TPA: DUF411 domain-containing protein [Vicinamibacterales bacterium]|nr:DUF411 domain-containing protein [Vicinamibacterales bacterium]
MRISRITFAASTIAVLALGLGVAAQQKAATPAATKVTVYKTSSCGCCRLWVDHMKSNGFDVQAMDVSAADVRSVSKAAGLKDEDTSCHTAKIGAYLVEGHVPADDIKRMLKEKPAIAGLAAPGMPQGSPGMEQGVKEPYDVIAFKKDGTSTVFAKHK